MPKAAFVFHHNNTYVGNDGCVDLNADCVLRMSPKGSDSEVLLYPFEKQLYAPAVLVKPRYLCGLQLEVIGEELQGQPAFLVEVLDAAQLFRVSFAG